MGRKEIIRSMNCVFNDLVDAITRLKELQIEYEQAEKIDLMTANATLIVGLNNCVELLQKIYSVIREGGTIDYDIIFEESE